MLRTNEKMVSPWLCCAILAACSGGSTPGSDSDAAGNEDDDAAAPAGLSVVVERGPLVDGDIDNQYDPTADVLVYFYDPDGNLAKETQTDSVGRAVCDECTSGGSVTTVFHWQATNTYVGIQSFLNLAAGTELPLVREPPSQQLAPISISIRDPFPDAEFYRARYGCTESSTLVPTGNVDPTTLAVTSDCLRSDGTVPVLILAMPLGEDPLAFASATSARPGDVIEITASDWQEPILRQVEVSLVDFPLTLDLIVSLDHLLRGSAFFFYTHSPFSNNVGFTRNVLQEEATDGLSFAFIMSEQVLYRETVAVADSYVADFNKVLPDAQSVAFSGYREGAFESHVVFAGAPPTFTAARSVVVWESPDVFLGSWTVLGDATDLVVPPLPESAATFLPDDSASLLRDPSLEIFDTSWLTYEQLLKTGTFDHLPQPAVPEGPHVFRYSGYRGGP